MDKELKAQLTAEEIVMALKPHCHSDLYYLFNLMEEEGNPTFETRLTPKGEVLKDKIAKILLQYE